MTEDFSTEAEKARKEKEALQNGPNHDYVPGPSILNNKDAEKKSMAEGIIADLTNQRQDIDSIKQALGGIEKVMNDQTAAINTLSQMIQQPQGTPIVSTPDGQLPTQGINMETIGMLGDLAEKAATAYRTLKGGGENPVDAFTQQITDNAKAEAIESLNIVHLINKKVKGKLVQDIAGDIAGNVINDSNKQSSHVPE